MSIRYPPEVEAAVRELYETYSSKEIAQILNERFPELPEFTALKVSSFKSNHGLIPGRSIKPKGISKFPEGLLQFMTENVRGRRFDELAVMVREHFGIEFTVQQARAYAKNHGLASGYDARFKKGTSPPNKGRKQEDWMSPEAIERTKGTRFQKGQMPSNHHEVGTVVVSMAVEGKTLVRALSLGPKRTRSYIRRMSGNHAYDMMRRWLTGLSVEEI
jgi:hypothetical protein